MYLVGKKGYNLLPILFSAFFRIAISVTIGLAIPLYLIGIDLSSEIIGIITSGTAMAYLFSPLIFRNIHNKLGLKLTLIISSSGALVIQIILQFNLYPLIIFILLISDGILLGFFWPVLASTISTILDQNEYKDNTVQKNKLMKTYSLSWNSGGIFGFILGTCILFFIDDNLIMFKFSLIFAIIGVIFAFFIKNPNFNLESEPVIPMDKGVKAIPKNEEVSFPLYIPLVMIGVYSFLIGGVGLVYPLKSNLLNFSLFTNYLFYAFRLSSQTITIAKSMDFNIARLKKLLPFSIMIVFCSLFLMAINQNIIIFGFLFFTFGMFLSINYTFSFKLIVFKNIINKTSKYSVYFETIVGFGYFFSPIVIGYIATFGIDIGFFFLTGLALFGVVFFVILRNKISIW